MTELVVNQLGVSIDDVTLVKDVSFTMKPGELVTVLGPNGAGKTKMLRAAIGLEKLTSGNASLGGVDTNILDPISRAMKLSYLPQTRPLAWPNRVRDIVALGRFSHGAALNRLKGRDLEAVENAMRDCDITRLANRKADTLSGGELARVHCARAFAAQAPLFVADEPVAALDPRHQFRVMDLIAAYVKRGGGALVVLHDIGLAARYADRMIWMAKGAVVADGPPDETLTENRLAALYGVKSKIDGVRIEIDGVI